MPSRRPEAQARRSSKRAGAERGPSRHHPAREGGRGSTVHRGRGAGEAAPGPGRPPLEGCPLGWEPGSRAAARLGFASGTTGAKTALSIPSEVQVETDREGPAAVGPAARDAVENARYTSSNRFRTLRNGWMFFARSKFIDGVRVLGRQACVGAPPDPGQVQVQARPVVVHDQVGRNSG
jgi:hypothetical protein